MQTLNTLHLSFTREQQIAPQWAENNLIINSPDTQTIMKNIISLLWKIVVGICLGYTFNTHSFEHKPRMYCSNANISLHFDVHLLFLSMFKRCISYFRHICIRPVTLYICPTCFQWYPSYFLSLFHTQPCCCMQTRCTLHLSFTREQQIMQKTIGNLFVTYKEYYGKYNLTIVKDTCRHMSMIHFNTHSFAHKPRMYCSKANINLHFDAHLLFCVYIQTMYIILISDTSVSFEGKSTNNAWISDM